MKQFFSTVLGSFVGVWVALILFSVLSAVASVMIFASMMAMGDKPTEVQDKSILHIKLAGALPERSNPDNVFSTLMDKETEGSSLKDILSAIKAAKGNDKIKGIYLECAGVQGGAASLYDIRKALLDFKTSKKFILAYGNEGMLQSDYYVATAADSIFLNPLGIVDIHGLSATIPFYKNLLDKVGVEMQVVRVGAFKSAVEPFITTEASPASKLQMNHYMGNIWGNLSDSIAHRRGISKAKFNMLVDSIMLTMSPDSLKANKIIDKVYYRYQVENLLKKLTGIDSKDDLRLAEPSVVAKLDSDSGSDDQKIAVVYAEGEIDGSSDGGIDSEDLTATILDIAKDEDVKAVVLRVNSPGGSAFGSEQIWNALEQVKKAGKPFAVSMGDVAASGGYYISCGADYIFAEPVTITGSIGIFGMIPCFKGLMQDKLGITQSVINTNANGNFISATEPMTPVQYAAMQRTINRGYEIFTSRCAKGRKMPVDSIKSIAQGRVWDGISAMQIGLIDEYGSLQDAINWVAAKAKLNDYETEDYPELKDPFMKYFGKYMTTRMNEMVKSETGELYKYHDVINVLTHRDKVLCLMEPVSIK